MHKPDIPFRTIISERNTWQHAVSGFLQKQLDQLRVADPFVVRNSGTVVQHFLNSNPGTCLGISIDVEDSYYALPHDKLMVAVKECITQQNDEVQFIGGSGIAVESFLELLSSYLNTTFMGWRDKIFLQKQGVRIGSRVAPVLSNIFLRKVYEAISRSLKGLTLRICRYVDDFHVLVEKDGQARRTVDVLKVFKENAMGFKFTLEVPVNDELQFLDLRLRFKEGHVCWVNKPRSKKLILNFSSGHLK
ncbi:uncharacterized protein LOC144103656 [Amblyomma americanum]